MKIVIGLKGFVAIKVTQFLIIVCSAMAMDRLQWETDYCRAICLAVSLSMLLLLYIVSCATIAGFIRPKWLKLEVTGHHRK